MDVKVIPVYLGGKNNKFIGEKDDDIDKNNDQ